MVCALVAAIDNSCVLRLLWWWWGCPIPTEGWGRGGIPQRPNSRLLWSHVQCPIFLFAKLPRPVDSKVTLPFWVKLPRTSKPTGMTFTSFLLMLHVKQGSCEYHFQSVLVRLDERIEPVRPVLPNAKHTKRSNHYGTSSK